MCGCVFFSQSNMILFWLLRPVRGFPSCMLAFSRKSVCVCVCVCVCVRVCEGGGGWCGGGGWRSGWAVDLRKIGGGRQFRRER